jgi:hypothetical protein
MKTFFLPLLIILVTISGCKKETLCQQGYTGTNCTDQIAPSKITITEVRVLSFEPKAWDTGNGLADVMVSLYASSGILLWESTYYTDCNPNTEYNFYPALGVFDLNSPIKLMVSDYDGVISTIMEQADFSIYSNNNKFPAILHLHKGYTYVDIVVSYNW